MLVPLADAKPLRCCVGTNLPNKQDSFSQVFHAMSPWQLSSHDNIHNIHVGQLSFGSLLKLMCHHLKATSVVMSKALFESLAIKQLT